MYRYSNYRVNEHQIRSLLELYTTGTRENNLSGLLLKYLTRDQICIVFEPL